MKKKKGEMNTGRSAHFLELNGKLKRRLKNT